MTIENNSPHSKEIPKSKLTTTEPTYYTKSSSLLALNSSFETFAFSAKERDVETGLSYFGARYYSSDLSIWLSVDPMSDKYPSLSPYTYCANNPVKLVDPNGEEIGDPLKTMRVRRNLINNTFGYVRHNPDGSRRCHQGIDYYAPIGTSVYAAFNGKVVSVSTHKDYGLFVTIQHVDKDGNSFYSFYAHLKSVCVQVGDNVVENGTVIGETGDSGNAKGLKGEDLHLHFEIRDVQSPGRGLGGRKDPNDYVDTKFVNDSQNSNKVVMQNSEHKAEASEDTYNCILK